MTGHVHRSLHRASRVATIPLCTHPAATTPVESSGALFARFPDDRSLPRFVAGSLPHQPFRGLHGVRYRCGLRARQITYVILYTEGFGRFVSSTTAPIATGWSESCRQTPLRHGCSLHTEKAPRPYRHCLIDGEGCGATGDSVVVLLGGNDRVAEPGLQ